eukprot:4015173-Amphidinium_carterae.1
MGQNHKKTQQNHKVSCSPTTSHTSRPRSLPPGEAAAALMSSRQPQGKVWGSYVPCIAAGIAGTTCCSHLHVLGVFQLLTTLCCFI